jgi:hypothetical protein
VLAAFDGENLDGKIGPAFLLVTTDPDGTPRPCMLSAGEIFAPDDRTILVAVWPGTKTSRNLSREGRILLCHVDSEAVVYVKGTSAQGGRRRDTGLEHFAILVDAVESDDHPGMPVTSGIRFTVEGDREAVLTGWRRTIDALRQT